MQEGGLEEIVGFDYDEELDELKQILKDIRIERPKLRPTFTDVVSAAAYSGTIYVLNSIIIPFAPKDVLAQFVANSGFAGFVGSVFYRQNRQLNKHGISSWPILATAAAATVFYYLFFKNTALNIVNTAEFANGELMLQYILLQMSANAFVGIYSGATLIRALLHPTTFKLLNHYLRMLPWRAIGNYDKQIPHWQKIVEMPSVYEAGNRLSLGDKYLQEGLVTEAIDEYYKAMELAKQPSDCKIPLDILKPLILGLEIILGLEKNKIEQTEGDKIRDAVFNFKKGKLYDAAKQFVEAISSDRRSPLLHIVYARFLGYCKLEEKAQREESFALELLPPIEEIGEQVKGSRNIVHRFKVRYDKNT